MKFIRYFDRDPGSTQSRRLSFFHEVNLRMFPPRPDPNPFIDVRYPRSAWGIISADIFLIAPNIPFEIHSLGCFSFYNGCEKNFSEVQLTMEYRTLAVTDITVKSAIILSYVTHGSVFLLLVNEYFHQTHLIGPENILYITSDLKLIFIKNVSLHTCFETASSHDSVVRCIL